MPRYQYTSSCTPSWRAASRRPQARLSALLVLEAPIYVNLTGSPCTFVLNERNLDGLLLAAQSRPQIWLIAQAAAASRFRHCSDLIHSDRLRRPLIGIGMVCPEFPNRKPIDQVSYATAAVTLSECRQQAASSARLLRLLTKTCCGRLHTRRNSHTRKSARTAGQLP
jgi:hypothetical protein